MNPRAARAIPRVILAALVALLGNAAATAGADATIVAGMGEAMPLAQALQSIAFRPFDPPRRVVGVALLPPFHGPDDRSARGIGIEYVDAANRRYALAEWPRNGGSIDAFSPFTGNPTGCVDVRTFSGGAKPYGIVWTTPHGLVMTLQADGVNDARTLESEWRKLIRRGACH